jgi:hypothetical protein
VDTFAVRWARERAFPYLSRVDLLTGEGVVEGTHIDGDVLLLSGVSCGRCLPMFASV